MIGGVETSRDLTEATRLRKAYKKEISFDDIVGKNRIMQRNFSIFPQIAESRSTVLITGPTGTGKELLARAIHNHSQNKKGPFVAVNCGAMPETLVESELFSYKKGRFREDLYYRINVVRLALPPLKEKKTSLLVDHFNLSMGKRILAFRKAE